MTNRFVFHKKYLLRDAISVTNEYLLDILHHASPVIADVTIHMSKALGKGIRTILLLTVAMDKEGFVHQNAVKAAAAVELLHLATLVHDDIIDDADLRRGIESVQHRFGKRQAVISGDYLLCLGLSILSSIDMAQDKESSFRTIVPDFTNALSRVCLGEFRQHTNNGNLDLDVFSYLRVISGKTAALFYISAYAGAVIGELDPKQTKALSRYGHYLGMIFQIIDDCKDYEFTEDKAQKPVRSDIVDGVVTLPLIMAIKKDAALRAIAQKAMDSGTGLDWDVSLLVSEVCRLGGTEDARFVAKRYGKKAEIALRSVSDDVKRQRLQELMQKALGALTQF